MSDIDTALTIKPRKFVVCLAAIAFFLIFAHIAASVLKYKFDYQDQFDLVRLFDLGHERNVPTFFSVLILFIAASILAVIAVCKNRVHDRYKTKWAILATGFLYLSMDEAASIHESFGDPTRQLVGADIAHVFGYAWVLSGIVISAAVILYFMNFWWNLPAKSKWLILVAASIYFAGAIGAEIMGGIHQANFGNDRWTFMLVTIEETFEMYGVIVFIYAILRYAESNLPELRLRIAEAPLRSVDVE